MRYIIISLCLFLSACAHDNYNVIPDSDASKANMSSDLRECKHNAAKAYFDSQPPMSSGQLAGVVLGGVVGGAIGGAVGGAAFGSGMANNDSVMKKSEINPYVERCMADRGYSGTSN